VVVFMKGRKPSSLEHVERCVEDDPRYAPAWARLGRIRHVMAKYLETGKQEELDRAEKAFRRALELNGDLAIAHKLYAQFEVDLGRAHDAMVRLVGRARCADPELYAGRGTGGGGSNATGGFSGTVSVTPTVK